MDGDRYTDERRERSAVWVDRIRCNGVGRHRQQLLEETVRKPTVADQNEDKRYTGEKPVVVVLQHTPRHKHHQRNEEQAS